MWGFINFGAKLASRYLLPRRWTRYVLLASVPLLSILTALLVDARLYWTAGMAGAFAVVCLIALGMQFFQASREKRERERQRAEDAARRAAASQARAEKIEKVRTSVAEAARGLGGTATDLTRAGAASVADAAKKGVGSARDRLSAWRSKPDAE